MQKESQTKSERIDIQRCVAIQSAHCPNGCDLMTDKVMIRGLKSIAVEIHWQQMRGLIYLDPEFGKYEHVSEIDVPEGTVVEFYCPHCGASLRNGEELCRSCAAPTFALILPNEGQIVGCLRRNCFEHTLKLESLDSMQLQIDDNLLRMIL